VDASLRPFSVRRSRRAGVEFRWCSMALSPR
jgi:hypothetical protein